ncbi:MAG: tetratricopeptide repeat protein [Candidatus Omnitrophica bacterium]|nr:tetratricopeptide repeat protein [Candidatus Omnitrophota bacterium]
MKSRQVLFALIILILLGFIRNEDICRAEDLDGKIAQIERKIILSGDYARLIDDLTLLLKDHPNNPRLYLDLGASHYGNMEYEKSYEFFKMAKDANPQGITARQISSAMTAIDDNRRMLQEIEDLYSLLREDEDANRDTIKEKMAFGHFAVLNSLLEDGAHSPIVAATHIVWLKDNKAEYPDLDRLKGEVYYAAGFYKEAEKGFKDAVEKDPTDYTVIVRLGDIYWNLDAKNAATKLFEKAVEDAPDYPPGHFFLARSYLFQEKKEEAMAEFEVFKEAVEEMPEIEEDLVDYYIFALHNLCSKYLDLKRFDIMAKQYEKIVNLKPADQIAHYNLAVWFFNYYNNPSRAKSELEKVVEIDSGSKHAESARHFLKFIRDNPDTAFIQDFKFVFKEE